MAIRLLALTLAVGLATCQQNGCSYWAGFQKDYEYIYDYESQILSGLPVGAKLYSGFKFTAKVHFQFVTEDQVTMKAVNPRLYEINKDIIKGDPTRDMIDTNQYREMLGLESDRIKTYILKTVKFMYKQGQVNNVVTESDDPEWSVNIKKGCLSLLEINFNNRNSLTPDVKIPPSKIDHIALYTVMEPSVSGECETSYKLKLPQMTGGKDLSMQKVRNYDRCLQKPVYITDITNGRDCDFCDSIKTLEPVSAQSTVKYNLNGTFGNALICSAVAESQYNFAPFTDLRGRMTTFANQTLLNVQCKKIEERIPQPASPVAQRRPLQASHPEQRRDHPASYKPEMIQEDTEEIVKMAMKVLKGIEDISKDKTVEEVSPLIQELKCLVKKLDKTSLKRLINKIQLEREWRRASKTLYDLLPMIGTTDAVDVLIDLMEDKPKSTFSSTMAFMSLALMPEPHVPMVKRVISYLDRQHNVMTVDTLLKRASWLCLGALGNKMVKTQKHLIKELEQQYEILRELLGRSNDLQARKQYEQRLKQIEQIKKDKEDDYNNTRSTIVQMVKRMHGETSKDSRRLAMKVIGTLGFEEFFNLIRKTISDDDIPVLAMIEAIIGLQSFTHTIPEQVRKLLLPVFFDRKQPEEIRSAAFVVYIVCKPQRPELEMIAETMRNEPSVNVGSLVWTTLKELSNKTTTCASIKSIVQNTTLALRYAKNFQEGLQYSSFTFTSAYDKNMQMGHAYEHLLMYSAKQRFPIVYAMQYTTAFFGKSSDVIGFGYKGLGLDNIFNTLSDDKKDSQETEYWDRLRNFWQPRSVQDWEQNIKDVKDKLDVKPRTISQPEGDIYVKVFGRELIYFDIASLAPKPDSSVSSKQSSLGNLLRDLGSIEEFLKTQKTLFTPLRHTTFMSETGLPLNTHVNLLNILRVDGHFEKMDSQSNPKQSVLKAHMSGLQELHCTMEVDMKYITSTVFLKGRVYTDIPLNLDITKFTSNDSVNVQVLDMKMWRVKMDSSVRTIINTYPEMAENYPILPEIREVDFVDTVDIKRFHHVYLVEEFGRKLTVEGQRAVRKDDNSPLPPFSGKQEMQLVFDPMQQKDINIWIQYEKDREQESSEDQTFSTNYTSRHSEPRKHQKRFLDLSDRDETVQYMKDMFRSDDTPVSCPWTRAVIVQMSDLNPNPKHWLQFGGMYGRSEDHRDPKYVLGYVRSPKPTETTPWWFAAEMTLNIVNKDLEPSDLQSANYQEQIQKQIRALSNEDNQRVDTLLDLSSWSLNKVNEQIEKWQKKGDSDKLIEDVINHIREQKNLSQDVKVIKDIVQEQRELKKDSDDLQKHPIDSKQAEVILRKVKVMLEKSKILLDRIISKFDAVVSGQQEPEEAVMVQYIVFLQTKMEKELDLVIKRLQTWLSFDKNLSLEHSLKEQFRKLRVVRNRQEQLTINRKVIRDQSPEVMKVLKKLQDMKENIVTLSESMDGQLYNKKIFDFVDKLIEDTKIVKEDIDKVIKDIEKVDRKVRVDVLAVLLLEKQAVLDIEQKIDLEEEQKSKSKTYSPGEKYIEDPRIKKMSQQKEELKKEASALGNRLVLMINNDNEKVFIKPVLSTKEQQRLNGLQKIELKQLQVWESLKTERQSSSDPSRKSFIQSMKKSVRKLTESSQKIREWTQVLRNPDEPKEPSAIVIKSLDIMSEQLEIIKEVRQEIKNKKSYKAVQEDFDMKSYDELKEDVEYMREQVFEDITLIEKSLQKDGLRSDPSVQRPLTLLQLQKSIIKMQSKKFELSTSMEQLQQKLSDPSSRQEPQQKKMIYSFIAQAGDLQTDLTRLHQKIDESQSEVSSQQNVVRDLQKIQQDLVSAVQKVENSVEETARTHRTFMQEIQTLQVLKDRVQRQQYDHKRQMSSWSYKDQPPQKKDIYTMYGRVAIVFGSEHENEKRILMKIFGRKSLEQLLWEKDQSSPLKQSSLVRQYLSDKRGQNDRIANGYREIKDELNTYRHLHIYCTYERNMPVELESFFWKIREYLKYRFYHKSSLIMPDHTNRNNTIEIKAEIKRSKTWMDLEIKSPRETVQFHSIHIPQYCQYTLMMPQTSNVQEHFIRYVSDKKLPATCQVSPDRLKTFDGHKYQLTLSPKSCETVLAMDCSPENKVVVTRKPVTSDPRKQIFKVITKRHQVELEPSQSGRVSVKVNNEPVDLSQSPVYSKSRDETVTLNKHEDGSVEVEIPELWLSVIYTPEHADVKLSWSFWSRVCGICGSMDGVPSNDFEGPQQLIHPYPSSFLSTYLVPGKLCDPQPFLKQHQVPDLRKQSSYVQPIKETKVKKTVHDGISKTCFSTRPVKKCPPSSQPEDYENVSVGYSCLRSSSPIARRLLTKVQTDGLLDSVPTTSGPTESIRQPHACIISQ